ncbi:hypothetical protein BOTBODRAFT_152803, partial [Botryobasidium botryosum FD-172 SS1]
MAQSVSEIDAVLNAYTGKPDGILGIAAIAVNKDGIIYSGASGKTVVDPAEAKAVGVDSVHWIASQSKLITTTAVMQCVERGQISLDDAVGPILPELENLDVIEGFDGDGKAKLRKAQTKITLRMLLTHTSGLVYDVMNPILQKWKASVGRTDNTLTGNIQVFVHPLVFEPGTSWMYGSGIDWAGQLVERLNKCTLGEYFQTNIFDPLGMTSTTFRLESRPDLASRKVDMTHRAPDGTLTSIPPPYPQPAEYDLGGLGLYSTVEDYGKILRAILQGSTGGILKRETIDEIFKPQVNKAQGEQNRVFWRDKPSTSRLFTAPPGGFAPIGVSVAINIEGANGLRAAGTGSWDGMPNLNWWIDRKTGIAATIFLQLLPPHDSVVGDLYRDFEQTVYKHVRIGARSVL